MARLVYHEHPRQAGGCLPGAFASYVGRIPLGAFPDLDSVWQAVRRRPFEPDGSFAETTDDAAACDGTGVDHRCAPAQRSRVWPATMNCWEATAHFVAAAQSFLGPSWNVHVWDRDLQNGARHVWPSLMTPGGRHLLVDLRSTAIRKYPGRGYDATLSGVPAANDDGRWYNQVLGGGHLAGGTVLRFVGLGKVADKLEELEGDLLPDWAKANPEPAATPEAQPSPPVKATAEPPQKRARGHRFLGRDDVRPTRSEEGQRARAGSETPQAQVRPTKNARKKRPFGLLE